MSTSTTTNLSLTKDNADEPIINLRNHNNGNLDAIDTAIKALQDAITNANALLGTLGVTNGTPDITAASARSTLGAATAGGAAATLYDAEQAIATLTGAVGNVDVTNNGTLQSQINSVRDSVGKLHFFRTTEVHFGSTSASPFILEFHDVDGNAYDLQYVAHTRHLQVLQNGTVLADWLPA